MGVVGNPNLYLDQPIIKGWCQPIGSYVSYHTDSPITTRLGLCSRLRYSGLWTYWISSRNLSKLKYHEISLFHKISFSCQIVLKFCKEHGTVIAVLCAKFSKRLGICKITYWQMRFREIWVRDNFRTDIPYCTRPQVLSREWRYTWSSACSALLYACRVPLLLQPLNWVAPKQGSVWACCITSYGLWVSWYPFQLPILFILDGG